MHFIISWLVTGVLFYLSSELGILIRLVDFKAGLVLSFFFALFYILIRFMASMFKLTGCLTLGLGYVLGLILQLIAYPLALLKAVEKSGGVSELTFIQAVILSILIVSIRDAIINRYEQKTKKRGIF